MIQGNGCPIVRNALTDYKALRDQYADQGALLDAELEPAGPAQHDSRGS